MPKPANVKTASAKTMRMWGNAISVYHFWLTWFINPEWDRTPEIEQFCAVLGQYNRGATLDPKLIAFAMNSIKETRDLEALVAGFHQILSRFPTEGLLMDWAAHHMKFVTDFGVTYDEDLLRPAFDAWAVLTFKTLVLQTMWGTPLQRQTWPQERRRDVAA